MTQKRIVVFIIMAVIVGIIFWLTSSRSASSPDSQNTPPPPALVATPPPPETLDCQPKLVDSATIKKVKVPAGDMVTLRVQNFGRIKIKLAEKEAPKTTENFKKLVASGFYDCLTFHRVAPGFVIQGGDPKGDGTGGPGFTVPAEIKLQHKRGSVAMARLPDTVNPKKESSGSQFYIALQDLPFLDNQYTVFGEVVEGIDAVDKIAGVELAQANAQDGPPKDKVVIESAVVDEK